MWRITGIQEKKKAKKKKGIAIDKHKIFSEKLSKSDASTRVRLPVK